MGVEKEKDRLPLVQITFGGCGGFYPYFLGVASVIQRHFITDNVIFSGSSAGCFPSLLLALKKNIELEFTTTHKELLREAREHPRGVITRWIPLVKKHILMALENEKEYEKANGKFYCSLTKIPYLENEIIGKYDNNEDLLDCMLASGYVGLYAPSMTTRVRGQLYIDGSLSNNSPVPYPHLPSKVLQIWHWRWINPLWVHVSSSEEWTETMFTWGKEDAEKNLSDLAFILTYKE